MSKRKRRQESGASWLSDERPSLEDFTVDGYGLDKLDLEPKQRLTTKFIPLENVYPNRQQPRRVIPSSLVYPANETMPEFLLDWCQHTPEIPIRNILDPSETHDEPEIFIRPDELSPQASFLLQIVELAGSIRRDGLTNPITVTQTDRQYLIETGERRWVAYQLLNAVFPDEEWSLIPAQVVPEYDVWRQASENSARNDLNAVARARQLAILLMNLYGLEKFRPFEAFEHEKDFYAQVDDGEEFRVPRGKGELLINAMGLKNTNQLRHYRAILRIPHEFWDYADDHNLTEGEIRNAEKSGYTVTPVTVSPQKSSKKPKSDPTLVGTKTYFTQFDRALRKARKGKFMETRAALNMIEEMRVWLREEEQRLRAYLEDES